MDFRIAVKLNYAIKLFYDVYIGMLLEYFLNFYGDYRNHFWL